MIDDESKTMILQDIESDRKELARDCKSLAEFIMQLHRKLLSDVPNDRLYINSLGEVQAQGGMIDAKCGSITTSIGLLNFLQSEG